MTDRARRSLATRSLAALIAATAWMAGPSLGFEPGARAAAAAPPVAASASSPSVAAGPPSVAATLEESTTSAILGWLNRDRVALGLRPLRRDAALVSIALDRARRMAGLGVLGHSVAGGDIGDALTAGGIEWFGFAEDVGVTTAPLGPDAAAELYSLWRASPPHWAALMSARLNYLGIAVADRPEDGSTYASIVFAESADRTAPVATMTGARTIAGSTGTAAAFSWRGSDPVLQTHTSGLRSFDLQYRVDAGAWQPLRAGTTATTITLARRLPGHAYAVRVRARDGGGNLSAWSRPLRVVVP
jgi:uncharacterized protein YkwD